MKNRLDGLAFRFTESEWARLRSTLGRLADHTNADAFISAVESFVVVASEEPSTIRGPQKKRIAAVSKAASELRAALEALTPDDKEELQSSVMADINETVNDVMPALCVLVNAAAEIPKHATLNQHARDGQAPARLLLVLSGRAWLKHFGKMPAVSKGADTNGGTRFTPFCRFMQVALGILGWPAGYDFMHNAFIEFEGDIDAL